MQIETQPINGSENLDEISNPEILSLSLFYSAFNRASMPLMELSWLNNDEVSMDNPIGGIRRGWDEIRNGYDKIFNGKAKVYVEFYDFTIHKTDKMFFATGRERGFFKTNELEIPLDIRTSRIFIFHNGTWRQIHHHGSIDNPDLLKNTKKQ